MDKASNYAYLSKHKKADRAPINEGGPVFDFGGMFGSPQAPKNDLNIFVLTFEGTKLAEKSLAGGDAYDCKKCGAILNKFSQIISAEQVKLQDKKLPVDLKPNQSYWECEFCSYPNILSLEKEEIPLKDDLVYMIESELQHEGSGNDSTIVFCIDVSGSMNSTTEITGKVDFKYGLSQEEIDMLKQFMQPGDQLQFNALPGAHNQNKTFVSRKQCILSAIETQLEQIRKDDPHKKVGFVLFNNEVTVLGDSKSPTLNILGDKLSSVAALRENIKDFKLTCPVGECYDHLISSLGKVEAKGQTALGPAIIAGIEVAAKGSKGSSVILCTDGLANIGVGALEMVDHQRSKFYDELGLRAIKDNVSVSIMAIKGQGCKVEVIGKLAQATNGNIRVVNPETLAADFASILKDQVIGLNVTVKIMLHRAMIFRNEDEANLRENKRVLHREFSNATVKTKISFQYEVRAQEDLKFLEIELEELKKVPFQAQITYTSPKGGKFMRVVSCQCKTTMERKEMQKEANIGVVHQRVTSQTANLFSKGNAKESVAYNQQWAGYLQQNFQAPQYAQQQEAFGTRNRKLTGAIQNKVMRKQREMQAEDRLSFQQRSNRPSMMAPRPPMMAPRPPMMASSSMMPPPPPPQLGFGMQPNVQNSPFTTGSHPFSSNQYSCNNGLCEISQESEIAPKKKSGFLDSLFGFASSKPSTKPSSNYGGGMRSSKRMESKCQEMECEDMDDMQVMNNAMEKQEDFK